MWPLDQESQGADEEKGKERQGLRERLLRTTQGLIGKSPSPREGRQPGGKTREDWRWVHQGRMLPAACQLS